MVPSYRGYQSDDSDCRGDGNARFSRIYWANKRISWDCTARFVLALSYRQSQLHPSLAIMLDESVTVDDNKTLLFPFSNHTIYVPVILLDIYLHWEHGHEEEEPGIGSTQIFMETLAIWESFMRPWLGYPRKKQPISTSWIVWSQNLSSFANRKSVTSWKCTKWCIRMWQGLLQFPKYSAWNRIAYRKAASICSGKGAIICIQYEIVGKDHRASLETSQPKLKNEVAKEAHCNTEPLSHKQFLSHMTSYSPMLCSSINATPYMFNYMNILFHQWRFY